MTAALDQMTRLWITSGHGELWDCDSTYCSVPYELLPELANVSCDLSWLNDFPDRLFDCTLDSGDNRISHLDQIVREIKSLWLSLPAEFVRFMSDSGLQSKVPTCTACYLELSEAPIAWPWSEPAHALRFINDSQCCIMWYLLLRPQMPTKVIASPYFLDPEIFEAMKDEDEGPQYKDLFESVYVCADSFVEFIYRFWVENAIWYSLRDKRPLSERESNYRRRITKKP